MNPVARRRSLVAAALAFGLVAFAFETARHSVHHLGEDTAGAECPLAAAASHIPGADCPVLAVSFERPLVAHDVLEPPVAVRADAPAGIEHQRAPPFPISA